MNAYLPVDEEQRRQFEDMVRNHPDSGVQAMEIGLLDDVEQRGLQRGKLEGKLEGRLEGQRDLLRQLLETRFGPLSHAALAKLETWPGDRLTELGRHLMSAASLEEVGLGASPSSADAKP